MTAQVSVIVPVFNKAEYLGDCLDSLCGQTFRDIEIICIDDASTDESGEVLRDYAQRDARLKLIFNKANMGPAHSRNEGIAAARGRYLRFVDADDLLPPDSMEILYSRAINDDVDLVRGSLAMFHGNDLSSIHNVMSVPDKTRTHLAAEQCLWIPWWHTSYLISTTLVRRENLSYPDLVHGEDPVFLASALVSAQHLSLLENIVYLYRKYPKDSGSAGTSMEHLTDNLRHAAITKDLFTSRYPECWYQGYAPFLLGVMKRVLGRTQLNAGQRDIIDAELVKIWGSDALEA